MDLRSTALAPKLASRGYSVVFWVSLALLASAVEPVVVKLGFGTGATALTLLAWKLIFGAIFMAPALSRLAFIPKESFLALTAVGSFFVLHYLVAFQALTLTPASSLVTFLALTPALVAILNRIRSAEKVPGTFWLWWLVCFFGIFLTLGGAGAAEGPLGLRGFLWCALAVILSALYRVTADPLTRKMPSVTVSAAVFAIAGVWGLALLPLTGPLDSSGLVYSAWMGLAGVAANIAFLRALSALGSTRLSILVLLQRPIVIVIAALVLKEALGFLQWAGVALVIGGAALAQNSRLR